MTGSGTLADPFVIWDVNDLQNVELDLAAYYELGQDIDASATVGWNGGLGFTPIGQGGDFTGSLDGKGFTISNLYMSRIAATTYLGLFKRIGLSGFVTNTHLSGLSITINSTGWGFAGGIAQENWGTITLCSVSGSIQVTCSDRYAYAGGIVELQRGYVRDCSSTATIATKSTNNYSYAGGISAKLSPYDTGMGVIERCRVNAIISAETSNSYAFAGGIVADNNWGSISKCYSLGQITATDNAAGGRVYAGGIAGDCAVDPPDSGSVDDCYSLASITADSTLATFSYCGGAFGELSGLITNCYSAGLITSTCAKVGGFSGDGGATATGCFWDTQTSGQAASAGGTGLTTAEMKTKSTFTDAGWNFDSIWIFNQVDSEAANNVENTQVVLNGVLAYTIANEGYPYLSVTPLIPSDCNFEWGETIAYGNITALQSETTGGVFPQLISGLTPATLYHFRTIATGSHTIYGDDKTFVTGSPPLLGYSLVQPELLQVLM